MAASLSRKRIPLVLTDANTNYPISDSGIVTTEFEVYIPQAKGGTIYIGDSTLDATWIPRDAGIWNYVSGNGNMTGYSAPIGFDLSKWFIRSTVAGDTVIIEYAAFI
jgi:hypothetical protein